MEEPLEIVYWHLFFLSSSVYQQDRREREQQDLELAKEMAEEDDEGF